MDLGIRALSSDIADFKQSLNDVRSDSDPPGIENAHTASTATFVTALWVNAAVFSVQLLAFTFLRRNFKSVYEPRTKIPPQSKRSPSLSTELFAWPLEVYNLDFRKIKHQNGMDAYFFVRFLRMMVKIFLPIWFISWPVLLPVTSVGMDTGKTGLDRFTFGNVGPRYQSRYAAHIVLIWLFTIWICYNIRHEMRHFIISRQKHLVNPYHSASAQANTILVTGVPARYLSEKALTRLFSHLPGGVRKVWLNHDLKDLPELYERRLKACAKLESAETALLEQAMKAYAKEEKRRAKGKSTAEADVEQSAKGHSISQYVPDSKRPSHRLPVGSLPFALPLIGKKVDTIEWAREEIKTTTAELEARRKVYKREVDEEMARQGKVSGLMGMVPVGKKKKGESVEGLEAVGRTSSTTAANANASNIDTTAENTYPPLNSAFILFHQQIAAHLAAQSLTHNDPYRMAAKYTEVAPADVLWSNLGMNPYEMQIRRMISYGITVALIALWAIPVAFIGTVSNLANLCQTASWLAWICTLPDTVVGIIQGVLPPLALAVLMMLLPIVLRMLASFEGVPTRTSVELSLMTRYFAFQVIHSFLIVTLSSGIIAALPGLIENPTSIPSLLASSLPQASNFFLTYVVLTGLSGTASGFLQIVPLVLYYVKLFILGSTPRSVYKIKYTLRGVQWGTLFPATTLLTVITIAYSVISPIINGLACMAFFLYYMMWKYLFLYQLEQPTSGDTGGLFFPKAIQHIFVGIYIQLICLAALFFLARDVQGNPSALPMAILTIVLIGLVAFFHMVMNNSYGPLMRALPLTLADKSHGMRKSAGGAGAGSGVTSRAAESTESVKIGAEEEGFGGSGEKSTAETSSRPNPDYSSDEDETHANHPHKSTTTTTAPTSDATNSPKPPTPTPDEPTDFYHPASAEPARIIWLPRDVLGLADEEVAACKTEGIEASCEHAKMDEKGHVDIDGRPPGMDVEDYGEWEEEIEGFKGKKA